MYPPRKTLKNSVLRKCSANLRPQKTHSFVSETQLRTKSNVFFAPSFFKKQPQNSSCSLGLQILFSPKSPRNPDLDLRLEAKSQCTPASPLRLKAIAPRTLVSVLRLGAMAWCTFVSGLRLGAMTWCSPASMLRLRAMAPRTLAFRFCPKAMASRTPASNFRCIFIPQNAPKLRSPNGATSTARPFK